VTKMKNAGKIEDPLTHKIIGCPEKEGSCEDGKKSGSRASPDQRQLKSPLLLLLFVLIRKIWCQAKMAKMAQQKS
jgi:hypothetical protein